MAMVSNNIMQPHPPPLSSTLVEISAQILLWRCATKYCVDDERKRPERVALVVAGAARRAAVCCFSHGPVYERHAREARPRCRLTLSQETSRFSHSVKRRFLRERRFLEPASTSRPFPRPFRLEPIDQHTALARLCAAAPAVERGSLSLSQYTHETRTISRERRGRETTNACDPRANLSRGRARWMSASCAVAQCTHVWGAWTACRVRGVAFPEGWHGSRARGPRMGPRRWRSNVPKYGGLVTDSTPPQCYKQAHDPSCANVKRFLTQRGVASVALFVV